MRYTPKRKAAIINAIQEGRVSEADVKREHGLSTEEITEWVKGFAKDGMRGLKVNIQRESHQMQLSWLRDRIATSRTRGEPVEALEACLSLGEALTKQHKKPVTHLMMSAKDD